MEGVQEKLLEEYEDFETELEVQSILEKVKGELTKKRMEKLMTLTIPLTDCRMPVTEYVQAFCDSLDAGDTNVSPPESFLQLLEEDGPTRLDSGTMQGSEPSDLDDLSFLQDLLSPDEWEQVMDDVQDFDVDDWLEDMPSSDEGVDLMYDLVS